MRTNMANLKQLKKKALEQTPAIKDITSEKSLQDNFVYSLLINTKYSQEIEGFSVVELSKWLQEHNIKTDFDLYSLIFN